MGWLVASPCSVVLVFSDCRSVPLVVTSVRVAFLVRAIPVRPVVPVWSGVAMGPAVAMWAGVVLMVVPGVRRSLAVRVVVRLGGAPAVHFLPRHWTLVAPAGIVIAWHRSLITTSRILRTRDRPIRRTPVTSFVSACRHHARSVEFSRTRGGGNRRPSMIFRGQ